MARSTIDVFSECFTTGSAVVRGIVPAHFAEKLHIESLRGRFDKLGSGVYQYNTTNTPSGVVVPSELVCMAVAEVVDIANDAGLPLWDPNHTVLRHTNGHEQLHTDFEGFSTFSALLYTGGISRLNCLDATNGNVRKHLLNPGDAVFLRQIVRIGEEVYDARTPHMALATGDRSFLFVSNLLPAILSLERDDVARFFADVPTGLRPASELPVASLELV